MTAKEIHAFLNEDGTYHITGICLIRDGELTLDATFDISRAKIDISPIADRQGRLIDFTIPEYEKETTYGRTHFPH
jgi:hypothetical protein